MPIKLDGEKILVTEGDQNYELERVKSYGYRNLSQETTQPPTIINNEDNIDAEYLSFKHDGSNNDQTTHTITFNEDTICDIFMIGGGGGGGKDTAGGGGSGAAIISLNNTLNGTYTIKVGNGGAAGTSSSSAASNGGDSVILKDTIELFKAVGGGGGGGSGVIGNQGGSAGGSGNANATSQTPLDTNIVNGITNIAPTSPGTISVSGQDYIVLGTSGGEGAGGDAGGGYGYEDINGGGGGGLGQVGQNAARATPPGDGGDGIYKVTINSVEYNLKEYFSPKSHFGVYNSNDTFYYIGGGGGGGGYQITARTTEGGLGGGGNGRDAGGGGTAGNGINNTGSGGGGGEGNTHTPGSGGTGLIIIRKHVNYVSTYTTEDITPEILTYKHDGSSNDQTTHSVTFDEDVVVDMLIVGGGGAGGTYIGGGGGGGGVFHMTNTSISAGTYNIKVGKGGNSVVGSAASSSAQQGKNSEAFGIEVFGGGYGGGGQWGASSVGQVGANGGSGGGGGSCHAGTPGSGGIKQDPNLTNATITLGSYNYYGGNGATSMLFSSSNAGGAVGANGGGGAGGNAPANTDQAIAGDGADGIPINITGTTYYWGGGGGGGQYSGTSAGNGGKGGGGGGNGSQQSEQPGTGGTDGITNGEDGDPDGDGSPTAGSGGAHTGGGGGGTGRTTGSPNAISGAGGSGIVIIKIHKDITHKKVVLKYDYKEDKKYPTIAADDTNLLAHYKFDGDFTDSSGNGNDLIKTGVVETSNNEALIPPESLYSDESMNYKLSFPSTIDLRNTDLTISLWFYINQRLSGQEILVFKYADGTDAYYFYTRDNGYRIRTIWEGPNGHNDMGQIGSVSGSSATVGYAFNINQWYLHTFVLTNSEIKEYINGDLIETRTGNVAHYTTSFSDMYIGKNANSHFSGNVDDLRIYDKALSETEIADLYKQSIVARFKNPSNSSAVAASKDWKLISYEPTGNNWFPDGLLNDIPSDRFLAFIYEDSGTYTWVILQKSVIEGNHNWSTYSVPTGQGSISSIGRYNDQQTTGSQAPIITTTTNVQNSSQFLYREESSSTWHSTPPANRKYYVLEEVIKSEYTLSFPTPRLCDILIVAGGGGGSESHGGGGGAGSVIFLKDVNMNGNYTIKVGNGGGVSQNIGNDGIGFKGIDSEIYKSDNNKVIAEGGGAGGATTNGNGGDGGSGGGGDGYVPAHSTGTFYPSGGSATAYTPILEGITGVKYGNAGGSGFIQNAGTGGGGGGAGGAGESATAINDNSVYGGVGIYKATISGVDYNFKTLFGLPTDNSIGEYHPGGAYAGSTYDTGVYFGGGGGGALWENPEPNPSNVVGGLGGGGTSGGYTPTINAENGLANSGGGGGGGGSGGGDGGAGGSGIVIIRYRAYGIPYDAQWKHQKNANIHFYGNVGIGTYANNNKLYVNGSVNVTGDYYKNNRTLTEWYNSTNNNIYKNYGNVGIGSAMPNYKLHVEGQIYAAQGGTSGSGNTAWTSTSDMHVKDNIKKASYIKCYNNINNIELYRFNYKPVLNNTRDINQLGFIAQEVEEIFPKSVKRNKMIFDNQEQEILALDVTQINYTLFGAVKYLAEKVEALKKRVNKIN